jgi:ribosome-binding protein aMBF1 (putative translation factor)
MDIAMAECYRCGASGSDVRLYDAISNEGVVQICEDCSMVDTVPVIRKPTTFQLKTAETPSTVYERLSNMAKLNPVEHRDKFAQKYPQIRELPKKQETSMRALVDAKYKPTQKSIPRAELVENFHWNVQRARRFKKISPAQLAKEIGESEGAILMIERGVLPEDDFRLINKLESYLNMKLLKKHADETPIGTFAGSSMIVKEKQLPKELKFDPSTLKELTIADLKEMKKQKEKKKDSQNINQENEAPVEEELVLEENVEDVGNVEEETKKSKWKFW